MTETESNTSSFAQASQDSEIDRLRRQVGELETKLAGAEQQARRSVELLVETIPPLMAHDRQRRQLRALLKTWTARETMFVTTTDADLLSHGLFGDKPTAQVSAAAATLMCLNDLANVLRCDNPDCPCQAKASETAQPGVTDSGRAQP